jgi:replicative DNA helicase
MMYRRICLGRLETKGELVLDYNWQSNIKDLNVPNYYSIFKYNEAQYEQFKETGTVASINDVVSSSLFFDFDSADNLEQAKTDTETLIKRLNSENIDNNDIQLYFSGNKGFTVIVDIDQDLTPKQIRQTCINFFGKNLATLDTGIYNASRILRVPWSKHEKGLYKIGLDSKLFSGQSIDQILTWAADTQYDLQKPPVKIVKYSDAWTAADAIEVVKHRASVSLTDKPNSWKACKWNLLQGNFGDEAGERHSALIRLAATCRGQGYDKESTYYLCKSALKKQADKTGREEFSKEELWNNIIEQSIFSANWQGGMYTCKSDPWLSQYCKSLGKDGCNDNEVETSFVEMKGMTNVFNQYAHNFETNIVKTGIERLDDNLTLLCSTVNGLLGQPGCHAKGSEILMYDGRIKKVEDIVVGDKLMGPDSQPREVLKLQRGRDKMIKIIPIKGEPFVINEHHILNLKPSIATNNKAFECNLNIMFKDYVEKTSKVVKSRYKINRVPVEFKNDIYKPIPPYILGTWLGDGTSNKPELTNTDPEIINEWKNYAEQNNLTFKTREITHSITHKGEGRNTFLDMLHGLEVFGNKNIPLSYLTGSKEERLDMLAGLLDTDGSLEKHNKKTFDYISKLKHLSEGVVFLCRSLGLSAYMKECQKGCWYKGEYKEGTYYRVSISGHCDMIPTRVKHKQAQPRLMNKDPLVTGFKYEYLDEDDYYGFTLDKDHLYLTSDFIVHHNSGKTSASVQILRNTSLKGIHSVFFSMDMGLPTIYGKLLQRETGKSLKEVMQLFKNKDRSLMKYVDVVNEEYKNVSFNFQGGLVVPEMKILIKERQQETGAQVKLVVIDYLECINGPFSESLANTGLIANQLKDLANELNVCIVLLLQTQKHSTPEVSDPLLTLKGVKGSSIVEQNCSTITSLWREGYSPDTVKNDNFISFAIVKNRFGSLWKGDFKWIGKYGRIENLTEHDLQQLAQFKLDKAEQKLAKQTNPWS